MLSSSDLSRCRRIIPGIDGDWCAGSAVTTNKSCVVALAFDVHSRSSGGLVSDAVIDGGRDIRQGGRRPSRTGNVSVSKRFREGTPDRFSRRSTKMGSLEDECQKGLARIVGMMSKRSPGSECT